MKRNIFIVMALAAITACTVKSVNAELKEKVESYAVVEVSSPLYDALSDNDKKIVDLFRQAGEIMDGLFWKQMACISRISTAAARFPLSTTGGCLPRSVQQPMSSR